MEDKLREQLAGIRHVALDMDGTIYLSNTIFPYTIDFLRKLDRLGITYSFLTNNPSKSLNDYLRKLDNMGIPASREKMYTTTVAMIDYIRKNYPESRKLFLLGTPSMISQFEEAGYISMPDSPESVPDIVVVSFDLTLEYKRLCRAAWWISRGLPYLATNPDRVCPTDEQTVLVDCGSICKCLESATGRCPDVTLGKPDPNMLSGICAQKGLAPDQIAMVGDRIYTDIEMALRAGAFGVLVLSGETTIETAKAAPRQPSLICRNVAEFGDLLEASRRL